MIKHKLRRLLAAEGLVTARTEAEVSQAQTNNTLKKVYARECKAFTKRLAGLAKDWPGGYTRDNPNAAYWPSGAKAKIGWKVTGAALEPYQYRDKEAFFGWRWRLGTTFFIQFELTSLGLGMYRVSWEWDSTYRENNFLIQKDEGITKVRKGLSGLVPNELEAKLAALKGAPRGYYTLSKLASSPSALIKVLQGYGLPPREAKQVAEAMIARFQSLAEDAFEEAVQAEPDVIGQYTGNWYAEGRQTGGGWHSPPEYEEFEGEFEYDGDFEYAGSVEIDTYDFIRSLYLPAPLKKQLLLDDDAFGDYLGLNAYRLISAMMVAALKYRWKKEWEEAFKGVAREVVEEGAEDYDLPLKQYADFEVPDPKCTFTHDANVTSDYFNLIVGVRCKVPGATASGEITPYEPDYDDY